MRRFIAFLALAIAAVGLINNEAFARRHGRGRRGGGGFGGTAASSAMMGYAALLRAQGMANLQNSQAAINWEKAKTLEIQNRERWVETYFKMRQINHAMRLAERGPAITSVDAIKLAHDAMPPPLGSEELDPATGRITYPHALRDPIYSGLREDVDAFFRTRCARHGSIDFNDLQQIETILDLIHYQLSTNLDHYTAGDYGHAATFLERLGQEAKMPVP